MVEKMPIVISSPIQDIPAGSIWLGGGEPDLKLSIDVGQFAAIFQKQLGALPVVFADIVG